MTTAAAAICLAWLGGILIGMGAGVEAAVKCLALELQSVKEHDWILVEAMAEVKATSDGKSDQPITQIVDGCIEEIREWEAEIERMKTVRDH